MKLNCKPGDLAVVIHPHKDLYGHFVVCVDFAGDIFGDGHPYWELDRKITPDHAGFIGDQWLRPMRDNPGQDEILRIVGLPEKEPA